MTLQILLISRVSTTDKNNAENTTEIAVETLGALGDGYLLDIPKVRYSEGFLF